MCFALYSIEYTEIQSFQTQILSGIYPQVQIESAYTQVENEHSNRYFDQHWDHSPPFTRRENLTEESLHTIWNSNCPVESFIRMPNGSEELEKNKTFWTLERSKSLYQKEKEVKNEQRKN